MFRTLLLALTTTLFLVGCSPGEKGKNKDEDMPKPSTPTAK